MKKPPDFKEHPIFFIALLVCTLFFASCSDVFSSSSSLTPSGANTQGSAITPIGAAPTCLTINPPTLMKLADGHFEMLDEIDNCGEKNVGSFQITTQINTDTTKQSPNLIGPVIIAAKGKAVYHTFVGQTNGTNKEVQLPTSSSSPIVTILLTISGNVQGEWDGQVSIPS